MENKRILLIGGTGSLGSKLVEKWVKQNTILNISRDEEKQWQLRTTHQNANLSQVIGDISNYDEIKGAVYNFNPHYILFVAALKHIDVCEKQPAASIKNNFQGLFKVLNDIVVFREKYNNLEAFLFVSTDKACVPVTVYGQTKAISEKLIQTTNIRDVRVMCVRYGNVLNSRGSILPLLHKMGKDPEKREFSLTHPEMTRFIMRLDESVELIEYSLQNGKNQEIIIPILKSCKISEMIEIFSDLYKKPIKISGTRCVEKLHEDLLSLHESANTYVVDNRFIHISPNIQNSDLNYPAFSSDKTIIGKVELENYLRKFGYI